MTKFQVSIKRWLRPADLSAKSISTALWVFCNKTNKKKNGAGYGKKWDDSRHVRKRSTAMEGVNRGPTYQGKTREALLGGCNNGRAMISISCRSVDVHYRPEVLEWILHKGENRGSSSSSSTDAKLTGILVCYSWLRIPV